MSALPRDPGAMQLALAECGRPAAAVPERLAFFLGRAAPDSLDGARIDCVVAADPLDRAASADLLGPRHLMPGGAGGGDGKEQFRVAGRAGGARPPPGAAVDSG